MKILVVGGGGREHAIVMKLAESPKVDALYCAPGNGGIAKYAKCFPVKATDIDGMVKLAKELEVDLVFVAPDDPLVLGMADAMQAEGFMTFGPKKNAAILEGSKVFSKELMQKYHIPTAEYRVFDDPKAAEAYLKDKNEYPTVIKADGLALGKGVVIAQNEKEAFDAIASIMEDKIFGESGSQIVIEEFLTGPEVSVLSFTDGKTVRPMVSSMDHKRALDGDQGLNTGGMGTVAPNPYYTADIAQQCMDTIFLPTIRAMQEEGRPFTGCLYFGLMLTPKGPKVIEYNCRFGDPETQVVLPLLESDLLTIMEATAKGELDKTEVKFSDGAAACVVLASGGYPVAYEKGKEITGLTAVPEAGDLFEAVEDERLARELAEQRVAAAKEKQFSSFQKVTLDNLFSQMAQNDMKELAIVVKADVQGSAEAVKQSLEKISNDEVRVRVIHAGVGAISKSDVDLADASNAIIIGFNVRPDNVAKEEAAATKVEMRMYRVIYDAINDVTDAMKGMLAPKFREVALGELQVRQVYKISNVGTVAGCRVTSGKITRDSKVRVVRDGIVITEDEIASLKRFKDDAKEVAEGYECGVTLAKFADVKEGDVYEAFKMEEYRD